MATLLEHVNNVLAQVGEQPLTSTVGNLGSLVKRELQVAVYAVVSQTRHSSFLGLTNFTVTAASALTASFIIPTRMTQVKAVFYRDVTTPTLPRLVKLLPRELAEVTQPNSIGYAIVGVNAHIGQKFKRPFEVTISGYVAPLIPTNDGDAWLLPNDVLYVVEAVAAAQVASSYIDDLNAQRALQVRAEEEVSQLRIRSGAMRAPISWTR
jgi:hypothetical protein